MASMPGIRLSKEGLYLVNRIEALEKKIDHPNLGEEKGIKQWIEENRSLIDCNIKQIAELKELSERNRKRVDELKDFRHNVAMPRIIVLEEVLREFFKWGLKYGQFRDMGDYLKELSEKLDSPKTEKKGCFNCESFIDMDKCIDMDGKSYKEFIYTTFKTGICNNYKKDSGGEKAEPEKELYELYLKDKENGEFNFKKITHPFTEYNNMVHRGIGLKLMPYNTKEELIEKFKIRLKNIGYCRSLSCVEIGIKGTIEWLEGRLKK